jgi:hypothetical protein
MEFIASGLISLRSATEAYCAAVGATLAGYPVKILQWL